MKIELTISGAMDLMAPRGLGRKRFTVEPQRLIEYLLKQLFFFTESEHSGPAPVSGI